MSSQKLSGSGKDYLQQTEQGPWFTGSCKFSYGPYKIDLTSRLQINKWDSLFWSSVNF